MEFSARTGLSATYDYDPAGRLEETVLSNGVTTTYGYDDAGRLGEIDHIGHWSLAAYTYTVNGVGNRTGVAERILPPTPQQILPLVMRNYSGGDEEMMGMGTEGDDSPFGSPLPAPDPFSSPLSSGSGGGTVAGAPPPVPDTTPFPLVATLLATGAMLVLVVFGQKQKHRRWAFLVAGVMVAVAFLQARSTLAEDSEPVDAASGVFFSPQGVQTVEGCVYYPSPIEGGQVISYTYDHLDRLMGAAYSDYTCYHYDYDRVGNREELTHLVSGTTSSDITYTYDDANRLTSVDETAYTWDQRGNLTHDGVFTYTYNAAGRMVRAESDALTLTLAYTYNADGLLMARQVKTDVLTYTWDVALGLPQVLATSDGAQYVHGLDLVAEHRDGEWSYPLGDALGSVRQWTDESGFITYRGDYTPFGVALSSEGSTESPWGYTGEWEDASLDAVYLRARWYQSQVGRFTRQDPWRGSLWQPRSMQGYAYTQNSPVIFRDPSGLCIPGLNCPFPDESQPDTVYEYYGNYYTLADCQGDAVANGSGALCRPWFDEYEFITIEALELFLDALYQDIKVEDTPSVVRALPGLVDHLIACEFDIAEWKDLADDRGHYETPFWNGRMIDTHVCIERHGCFLRSEVNYLAQGMWGAQAGEPVILTGLVADAWNRTQYGHWATPGEVYWLEFGWIYYHNRREEK